jgi:hypothetical protein
MRTAPSAESGTRREIGPQYRREGSMGNKSKRNRRSKSGIAVTDTRGQAGPSARSDTALGLADRDMRAKCAEIAASLPFKPTDVDSVIRDAQKLFDWITTGDLPGLRALSDAGTKDPHSSEDADIDRSKSESPNRELPPMPVVTAFDNVVEQIMRDARDDDGLVSVERPTAHVRTP